jgi:16S rRNA processing protein RimM
MREISGTSGLNSKSSIDPLGWGLAPGKVAGHRGRSGEMTVRVLSGDATRWTGISRVGMARTEDAEPDIVCDVEAARAYRDRLVLKLTGVDDANAVQALRGLWVRVLQAEVPTLPHGRWYQSDLVGREVRTREEEFLGLVENIVETGGVDLLQVVDNEGRELLIPMTPPILLEVGESGAILVDLPDGLRELDGE